MDEDADTAGSKYPSNQELKQLSYSCFSGVHSFDRLCDMERGEVHQWTRITRIYLYLPIYYVITQLDI